MSTKQVTCRYFLHGVCREGSRCLFSHDPTTSKPSTICKYYQRGVCAYGERCRYDHIRPPGRSGATAEQSTGSGAGGGARGRQGARRGVILRDRGSGAYQDTPLLSQLCPYAAAGQCHYGNSCPYLHGDLCDICRLQVLHPHDPEQRRAHQKMCMLAFESDMERAFAAQLSQDKVCSICMEVVVQKVNPSERRFGILSACSHTYCLTCIRQWRCAKQFDNKIIKSCPECRVVSEFVIPSVYWVENQDDKNKLIDHFKSGVSKKACKYFDQGRGSCPFGGKCLYLHAYPDGTRAQPDKPRKQLSSEGNIRFLNSVRLWDFIEEREQRSVASPLSLDDDVTELRELFMQMSGSSQDSAAGPLPDPARPDQ
ncbi:E3 ubiquitin-protein ligase makorin-2 isoform X2 [Lampris incognitus]|uniref:E3 ubiquitin-protein ligase makorin-2 isoform X2 n=1 Tax=Lampris incognitus TaxID=2546036 RepID=UPI0024B4E67F|nr:E3 ubiquitin-protein ligase makorin-2 isoform X2 [Lampris incognitus]